MGTGTLAGVEERDIQRVRSLAGSRKTYFTGDDAEAKERRTAGRKAVAFGKTVLLALPAIMASSYIMLIIWSHWWWQTGPRDCRCRDADGNNPAIGENPRNNDCGNTLGSCDGLQRIGAVAHREQRIGFEESPMTIASCAVASFGEPAVVVPITIFDLRNAENWVCWLSARLYVSQTLVLRLALPL